jgi:hypothetical protein
MLRGGLKQIGDDGNGFTRARRLARFRPCRIDRPFRPVIHRRLRQHIIIERDLLPLAALGISAAAFFRDRTPIGARLLLEGRARLQIFLQLAAIFRNRLRRSRLRICIYRCCWHDDAQLRRRQQQRERKDSGAAANRRREHVTCLGRRMGKANGSRNTALILRSALLRASRRMATGSKVRDARKCALLTMRTPHSCSTPLALTSWDHFFSSWSMKAA